MKQRKHRLSFITNDAPNIITYSSLDALLSGRDYTLVDLDIATIRTIKGNGRISSEQCPVLILHNRRTDEYALCVRKKDSLLERRYSTHKIENPKDLLSVTPVKETSFD